MEKIFVYLLPVVVIGVLHFVSLIGSGHKVSAQNRRDIETMLVIVMTFVYMVDSLISFITETTIKAFEKRRAKR